MISETDGLVLDVVVAASSGRLNELERTVRQLRADLDRRFPSQRTRITIACEPETAPAAERLSETPEGVRAVRDPARFAAACATGPPGPSRPVRSSGRETRGPVLC